MVSTPCCSSGPMSSMMPGVSSGTARRMPSYRSRERSVPVRVIRVRVRVRARARDQA